MLLKWEDSRLTVDWVVACSYGDQIGLCGLPSTNVMGGEDGESGIRLNSARVIIPEEENGITVGLLTDSRHKCRDSEDVCESERMG